MIHLQCLGVLSLGVTPVPIPNTAVKLLCADGTRALCPGRVGRRQDIAKRYHKTAFLAVFLFRKLFIPLLLARPNGKNYFFAFCFFPFFIESLFFFCSRIFFAANDEKNITPMMMPKMSAAISNHSNLLPSTKSSCITSLKSA